MKNRPKTKRYNSEDHAAILIANAARNLEVKHRETYAATWLIEGGIGSSFWLTSVPGKNTTEGFSFDRIMGDGTNLCDPINSPLLESIQKAAFDLRMGKITGSHVTVKRWRVHLQKAVKTASWVCLNRKRFYPEKYAFSRISEDDCKGLLDDLSSGGWPKALKYKDRLLAYLHQQVKSELPLEELLQTPDTLPPNFVEAVCNWMTEKNLYNKSGRETHGLSRKFLSRVAGITGTGASKNFSFFLRQFETHLNSDILKPYLRLNRIPSQNMAVGAEEVSEQISNRTFSEDVACLNNLFKGHMHYPESFPEIVFNLQEIKRTYANRLKRNRHTPLIPLTIGLEALNQAARWVIEFGPAIIEATIHYTQTFNENYPRPSDYWEIRKKDAYLEETFDDWTYFDTSTYAFRKLSSAVNVTTVSTREWRAVTVRECDFMSLTQAFVGACVVIIGMLKPLRDQEITHLPRDCLTIEDDNKGTRLLHEQQKSGVQGINDWITRAIPSITARAVQLMQVMGSQLSSFFGDKSDHGSELFYFPGFGFTRPKSKHLNHRLSACLDKFCDIIEVPLDKHGRRWYIRVHEMRKFFILVSHRHGGDLLVNALRYHAGQKDPDHIYSYIAPDVYDDLYIRYETECIEDKLIALECAEIDKSKNQGLLALYESTCKHFGVSSISGVSSSNYQALLAEMRRSEQYEVSTYSILMNDFEGQVECLDFAIKFRDIKDEKFDK
jgi:hypothetical protein